MRVEIKEYHDSWGEIKDAAMMTIGKSKGKYPDSKWKTDILQAEHSPIRLGRFIIRCYDVPSFVIGHLVRHNIGFTPFVSSLRSDRAEYDEIPNRNTLNNFEFEANFQSLINISRRRLCTSASKETRELWNMVIDAIREYEPELANCCRKECIYRGKCYEMWGGCGYDKTEAFQKELEEYRGGR